MPRLWAEAAVTGKVSLSAGALADDRGISSREELSAGDLTIGIDTLKNATVKASASLRLDSAGGLTLERAWAKARFPWILEGTTLRLTAGLAPLSWGKGFLFNAGDPVFGELPALSGLSSGDYRISAAYMASLYAPLGDFSFTEALWLPSMPQIGADGGDPPAALRANRLERGGGRIALVPSWRYLQSLEAGWLHEQRGFERGYLAAEGSLWADWYAAASFASEDPVSSAAGTYRSGSDWSVSAGLFRMLDFPNCPVTLRFEALSHPGRNAELWFGLASVGLNEVFSVSLQGLAASGREPVATEYDAPGTVGNGALWSLLSPGSGLGALIVSATPFTGYTLSASALRIVSEESGESGSWIITARMAFSF